MAELTKNGSGTAAQLVVAARKGFRRLFLHNNLQTISPWVWAWAVFEAFVFCVVALAVAIWIMPGNPFGVGTEFPWLWIVPAVLSMRYGTGIGVTAVVILVLSWFALPMLPAIAQGGGVEFPKAYFLGGLILVLICGQFSDVWNVRSRRLRAVNAYLDERLQTLTKNHFLLRLSHERLEQDLLAKPLTLRETLVRLRAISAALPPSDLDPLPGAQEFIQLLGQSCQLEIASLHAIDRTGHGVGAPMAVLGEPGTLATDDPLYRYAVEQEMVAHVQTGAISELQRGASKYLICAPLSPSNGRPLGMLIVERLPFFALNEDTLQLLSVLIGYYADGVRLNQASQPVLAFVPNCPPEFALDIVRLHRIRLTAGIDSSLVALVFRNDDSAVDIYDQVRRLKRGVDLCWEVIGIKQRALITLLPLAGSAAVEGYLLRIETALRTQFGIGLLQGHVATHKAQLGFATPAETLYQLVERCDL